MRIFMSILVGASLCLGSTASWGHHSNSAYSMSNTATVTGVVEELTWRNPHVVIKMSVENEDGSTESWALETAGINDLVRNGWNRDVLAPGTPISAEIRPTVQGIPGGILRWVVLQDGQVLPIDRDSPQGVQPEMAAAAFGGASDADVRERLEASAATTLDDYRQRQEDFAKWEELTRPEVLPKVENPDHTGAFDPDNLAKHEGVATFDFTGIWSHRPQIERAAELGGRAWEFLPVPPLTEKSKAIQADILARRAAGDATADPATFCYPHGLVRSMTRVGNMMLMQQNTALFMVHRMNNDYRAVYWDGRDHVDPSIRIDSYNGDSIAYWEDDHLYVETVGFGQNYHYINAGIPIGKQGKIVERWSLINDGNTLAIEFRMTDPEHWEGEWIETRLWDRNHGADIYEANCIVAEDGDMAIGGPAPTVP